MSLPFAVQLFEKWLPPDRFFQTAAAPRSLPLRAALACVGSLTRYLEEQTGQTVKIRLESQERITYPETGSPLWDQRHQLSTQGTLLSRNAWLILADQERIFAHSQIVMRALPEEIQSKIERGKEPLGALFLERQEPVERTDLEVAGAYLPALAHRLGQEHHTLYPCRRSLFRVNRTVRARIVEIFLPSLFS